MSTFIPRLAQIAAGHGARKQRRASPMDERRAAARVNIDTLAALVPQVRHRLGVSRQLSDEALLASLIAIARHPSHEARWRAAEASTLGHHLAGSGRELRHTLVTLLTLLPKPYL